MESSQDKPESQPTTLPQEEPKQEPQPTLPKEEHKEEHKIEHKEEHGEPKASSGEHAENPDATPKTGGTGRLRKKSSFANRPKEQPMKAVFVTDFNKPLIISELVKPKPKSGEVLIKVEAAPIHASDLGFIQGGYLHLRPPFQVGLEGSGTVIASGGGFTTHFLVGKRVAFGASVAMPGSWAQYIVTSEANCFPIDDNISFEAGACGIINPFTTIGLVETLKAQKFKAVVLMTIGSQLSVMITRMLKKEGFKIIVIIGEEDHRAPMVDLGVDVIISTQEADFEHHLRKEAEALEAKCLVECVCGDVTHKVLRGMPRDSVCYLYDHLEREELTQVDFGDLLKNNKTIKSFMFSQWFEEQGFFSKRGIIKKVHDGLLTDYRTEISKVFDMDQINEAIEYAKHNMVKGKVVIRPNHTTTDDHHEEKHEDDEKKEEGK